MSSSNILNEDALTTPDDGKPEEVVLERSNHTLENPSHEQMKLLIICSYCLLALACFFTLYIARPIFFPIVLAIYLNFLMSPLVRFFRKVGIPNALSSILILSLLLFLIGFSTVKLVPEATKWVQRAPQTLVQIERRVGFIKQPIKDISDASERLEKVTEIGKNKPKEVVVKESSLMTSLLTITGSSIGEITIALILTYFLLSAGDRFLTKFVELMPTLEDKKIVVEIARSIEENISAYLLSVSVINLCMGALISLAMWALGVPNPILWGVIAAILNYIPYLGSLVGICIISLVSIVSFDNFSQIITVPIVYASIDWFEGSFISPWILGLRLKLNPPVILTWLLFWGWLWGPWGAILAVPMLASIKILCDHVKPLQPLGKFLVT